MCLVGSLSALRVRQKLSEQNMQLDVALNNMIQGLCMFDAQNRLVVWNERYRAMYNIDPQRIWRGCGIRDLLDARKAAGTFPHDPAKYEAELRAALDQGKTFTLNIELKDGRIIAVVNAADQRRRLGGHARRTSPSASAPSANSNIPARSSIRSSRTCRRRSS